MSEHAHDIHVWCIDHVLIAELQRCLHIPLLTEYTRWAC